MLDAAAEAGELWPGRRILEPSSGNTGIALAMQGRLRGLGVTIVMPAGSTPEREQLMRLFGADVIYSPAELGSNGAVTMARELAEADPTLYMPFQYGNAANPRAHERGTAEEILTACPEVDVFVAGLGTGGTLMGCARRLRRDRPDVLVVAAEPLPGEGIDGLRSLEDGYTPEILDLSLLDRKLLVSNEDSVRGLRALAREEGLFAGVSSGGVLHAALRVARDLDGPANIVMVLADGGWKYLSAGLWDTPESELLERMEQGVWW
jgi:cysteine synthase B